MYKSLGGVWGGLDVGVCVVCVCVCVCECVSVWAFVCNYDTTLTVGLYAAWNVKLTYEPLCRIQLITMFVQTRSNHANAMVL